MNKELLEQELKILSPDQRKAVESKNRFLRIVAGAGAGKTTTMAMRIVKLLSQGIKPDEIASFTFTERAAQNMKNRVYEKIGKIEPELCNHLGEMYIGTIHAFCFQMLQDHFGYGNYEVMDENQEMAFMLRHGFSFGLHIGGGYIKKCSSFLKSIEVIYNELLDFNKLQAKQPDFFRHFQKYEELLNQHKLLTFSKIINVLLEKLKQNSNPIQHIQHLIVDEYQDVNQAQQELIKLIGQKSSIYVVGDPRQCIYQWRGSDDECFDNFLKVFDKPETPETIIIPENRRSCIEIVQIANLFAKTLVDKYDSLTLVRKDQGKVVNIEFENPELEAEFITDEIKKIVEVEKKCNYSNIAILLRSVKTSAEPFISCFKKKKIPYLVGGKIGLFRRDEAKIVGSLFSWLHEEGFWLKNSYDWNKPIKGQDLFIFAKSLWEQLFKSKDFPEKELKKWKGEVLDKSYNGLTEAFQELLLILGFLKLDQNDKLNAAIMANLGRFNSLLIDFQSSVLIGGESFNWERHIKSLIWFINSYANEAYEEQPAEDIRGVDAVQIMTVHQAKGLEWLMVFMPALTNLRFPSSKSGKEQDWMINRDLFPVKRYEGSEDDERRLFYVAMTRARDFLCLSRFKQLKKTQSESHFLTDLKLKPSNNLPVYDLYPKAKEEEIQTFIGGEIIDYVRCSYRYRLRHLWNYQSIFSPMLGYGKSLHHCLRTACDISKEDNISPEEALEKVFHNNEFHLPYAGKRARETATNDAKKTLKKYITDFKEDIANVEEVEARLEFPLEKSTIAGRVDVIIGSQDKSLEVRDYKTSEEVTSEAEAALQVQLYTLGLKLTKHNVTKASISYFKDLGGGSQIVPVGITDKDLLKAKETAKTAISGIRSNVWNAKIGDHCKGCDFKKICRYTNVSRDLIVDITV